MNANQIPDQQSNDDFDGDQFTPETLSILEQRDPELPKTEAESAIDDELKPLGFTTDWATNEESDKSFEINSKMVRQEPISFSGPSIHKCVVFNNGDTVLVFNGNTGASFVRIQPGEYLTNQGQIRKLINAIALPRAIDSEYGLPIEYHGFNPAKYTLISEVPTVERTERNTNLCQFLNGARAPRFEDDGEPCVTYNVLLGENIAFTDLATKEHHVIPTDHYLNTQGEVQRLVVNDGFAYDYSNGNPLKFIGHLNETQTLAIAKINTSGDTRMPHSARIAQRFVNCGALFHGRTSPLTLIEFFRHAASSKTTVINKWQMGLLDAGKTLCCFTDRGLMPFQKQGDDAIALREWQASDIEMFLEFLPVFYYQQINMDRLNQVLKTSDSVKTIFQNILACPTYQQLISWLNNTVAGYMFAGFADVDTGDLEPIIIHGRMPGVVTNPMPSTVPGYPMSHPAVYPTPYNSAGSFANHFGTFAQAHPGMSPQTPMMSQHHVTSDERTYGTNAKMFRPL